MAAFCPKRPGAVNLMCFLLFADAAFCLFAKSRNSGCYHLYLVFDIDTRSPVNMERLVNMAMRVS